MGYRATQFIPSSNVDVQMEIREYQPPNKSLKPTPGVLCGSVSSVRRTLGAVVVRRGGLALCYAQLGVARECQGERAAPDLRK